MNYTVMIQLAATVLSAISVFSAYRARDNERAGTLFEIKNEIKHISRRLDALEEEGNSLRRIKIQREESA